MRVPYNLRVSQEERIYDKLLNQSNILRNVHIAPNTLKVAAMFAVMTRLEEHRVAFQSELAARVTMKFTPHLLFHLDESIARGSRIVEILQQIDADDRGKHE